MENYEMEKLIICECECKKSSHESFNSAYIVTLCKLFNNKEIYLFAHKSHIEALKNIWKLYDIELPNLKFCEIEFESYDSFKAKSHYINIIREFNLLLENESKKCIFITSINPLFLNYLNESNFYSCSIVHGGLEELNSVKKQKTNHIIDIKFFLNNLLHLNIRFLLYSIKKSIMNMIAEHYRKRWDFKDMLLNCDQKKNAFIFNSSHIIENLKKVIPIKDNFFCIPLFRLPPKTLILKEHADPHFAILGYGADNNYIIELAKELNQLPYNLDYEIRNIGMRKYNDSSDNIHFRQLDKGFLKRKDMEYLLRDIDFLLNFYTPDSYKFGCSGSIIEAIFYEKPVVYLTNDTYNAFNNVNKIGIECLTLNDMIKTVKAIIINWENFRKKDYYVMKENTKIMKEKLSINNSIIKIEQATMLYN